jgi:hypothetical protein
VELTSTRGEEYGVSAKENMGGDFERTHGGTTGSQKGGEKGTGGEGKESREGKQREEEGEGKNRGGRN